MTKPPTNKPDNDELDYIANRLANGTMPENAKYIFSKDDWTKFKQALSQYVKRRERVVRKHGYNAGWSARDRTAPKKNICPICKSKMVVANNVK